MQSPSPVQIAVPPVPPAPPGTPVVVGLPQQTIQIPLTSREIRALRDRRSEISDQLTSATERRNSLAQRLKTVEPAAAPGLVQRINLLDERILLLENDLATVGRQLAAAPTVASTGTRGFPIRSGADAGRVIAIGGSFMMMALTGILVLRFVGRRWSSSPRAALSPETDRRLERLEQGVDAIAIEVERIAEGQRFMTKILTEREMPLLGEGAAEPIHMAEREAIPVGRRQA